MATGDKKQVVMAADRSVANGVATLGADALLALAQRPKAGGLYRDDGNQTLEESLTEISTTLQNKAEKVEAQELKLFGYISPELQNGVKNYIEGNVFHRKVGRVELGALSWSYADGVFVCFSPRSTKLVCSAYEFVDDARINGNTAANAYLSNMQMTYRHGVLDRLYFKNTSCADANEFKAAVSGIYLYYELETEETYNILDCDWSMPPMELGVEYRTTERYLGKPVYAKVVDFGPLPNNTEKQVKLNINGIQHIVDCSARYSKGDRIPSYNTATSPAQEVKLNYVSNYNGGFVRIASNYDASASGCYVSIKYTKTTD